MRDKQPTGISESQPEGLGLPYRLKFNLSDIHSDTYISPWHTRLPNNCPRAKFKVYHVGMRPADLIFTYRTNIIPKSELYQLIWRWYLDSHIQNLRRGPDNNPVDMKARLIIGITSER